MEDDLNFFSKIEDDFNFLIKWKMTSICWQNGTQPQFFGETTSIFRKLKDSLNL